MSRDPRPACRCPMRDGAHEAVCGHVGEYEAVHCSDCDAPTWMCAVAMSRCPACRATYLESDEYKARLRRMAPVVFADMRDRLAKHTARTGVPK